MSYQQQKVLVTISTGTVLFLSYCVLLLTRYNPQVNASDLHYWASTMLSFIGIGIVIHILALIAFHILFSITIAIKQGGNNEQLIKKQIKQEMVEDERDNIFSLKSLQVGYMVTGAGIVAGLFSLVLNYAPAVMLNIIFLGAMVGSIVEGFVQLYLYSKHQ